MLLFIDEAGKHHSALADVKETKGVNGEKSISGTIYSNDTVIEGIGRGWKVKFNDEMYCLTYVLPVDQGRRNEVEFDAVHEFFFDMQKSVVYSTIDGSNTMKAYLDFIFNGSGYTYRLEVTVSAFEKQNFGMKNRLDLFKDIIQSTGLEFSVNGKIVRILQNIGTDLSTVVKKGFNLNELKIEKDTNSFITYLKGYGAYIDEEDHSKGQIEAEYLSPLADIYGKLEGDPISDERYTIVENLTSRLEEEVNNSYGVSVSLNMEDLVSAGYEYDRPHEGDYIMAINDDLHFREKIRIVSYTTTYDVNGNILDHEVTAGSDSLVDKSRTGSNDRLNGIESDLKDAVDNSNKALTSADGKNTVYYGPNEPQGQLSVGDIWYQVNGEDTVMKFWNGYEWELFFDPAANKKEVEDAQSSADDAKVAADNAYTESVQKAEELVDEASNAWDQALNDAEKSLNEGVSDAISKSEEAQNAADTAHQEALDAAAKANANATDIVMLTTDLGRLQTTVTGENGLVSQITQQSNQISTLITDVNGNSSSIVQLSDQISTLITDVAGNSSSITQLASDIELKVSKDGVVSSINLSPELIRISGKKIQLDGDVLIKQAWITNLYADQGFITNLETKTIDAVSANITSIITNSLSADTITSTMIKSDTGLIDKLFATTALIEQLTSKTAFINSIKAIDISADRIVSGTIDAADINVINLNADNIVTGSLTAIQIVGPSLLIDLATGEVTFSKGNISSRYMTIDVTNSLINIRNSKFNTTDYYGFNTEKIYWGDNRGADGDYSSTILASRYASPISGSSKYQIDLTWETFGNMIFRSREPDAVSGSTRSYVSLEKEGLLSLYASATAGTYGSLKIGTSAGTSILSSSGKTTITSLTSIDILIDRSTSYAKLSESKLDLYGGTDITIKTSTGSSSKIYLSTSIFSVQSTSATISATSGIELSVNSDKYVNVTNGTLQAKKLNITGTKNAVHVTRDGVRATPAYETAESYLGDIGRSFTDENCEVWVEIETLFSDTVNTDIPYEVFIQAYDDSRFWIADFKSNRFLVRSDKPLARFAWELKAKRRGFELDRLELQNYFSNEKIEETYWEDDIK